MKSNLPVNDLHRKIARDRNCPVPTDRLLCQTELEVPIQIGTDWDSTQSAGHRTIFCRSDTRRVERGPDRPPDESYPGYR